MRAWEFLFIENWKKYHHVMVLFQIHGLQKTANAICVALAKATIVEYNNSIRFCCLCSDGSGKKGRE